MIVSETKHTQRSKQMNDVIKNMLSRRSIRKFTSEEVSKETIELLLRAAMSAPSACNQQIWRFLVVTDRQKLEKISTFHNGVKLIKDAPAAIVICGEPTKATLDYYWLDDCGAATENVLLAAHSLGLGAVWTGINRENKEMLDFYRETLGIKGEYIPFSMIAFGYPAEAHTPRENYDENKVIWC